jgi:hypothetical protein
MLPTRHAAELVIFGESVASFRQNVSHFFTISPEGGFILMLISSELHIVLREHRDTRDQAWKRRMIGQ